MIRFAIFLALTFSNIHQGMSSSKTGRDFLNSFGLSQYSPVRSKNALTDIAVELYIPGLKERIEKSVYTKFSDVRFILYWEKRPGKAEVREGIEIKGLPKGHELLAQRLKEIYQRKIDTIIHPLLEKQFEGYSIEHSRLENGTVKIVGVLGEKSISYASTKVALFDRSHRLTEFIEYAPTMKIQVFFKSYIKDLKYNSKFLPQSMVVETSRGVEDKSKRPQIFSKSNIDITYKKIGSFTLPTVITSNLEKEERIVADVSGKKTTYVTNQTKEVTIFRNYELNKGVAKQYFRKMNRAKR